MILPTTAGCAIDTSTGEHIAADGTRSPWSESEAAWAAGLVAKIADEDLRTTLIATLQTGITDFTGYRDTAQADIATATQMQTDAATYRTTAQTLAGTAFAAAPTYQPAQLQAIADSVKATATRQGVVFSALANLLGWRAAVDQNAVKTDQALIYLAKLWRAALS